ncbi:amino acid permease [Singulisphaera sp. PoT]|uniref:amino acid permease n=1 Tax=Singulisphaera sp. PoT TaxID=3411797 RepID=UPI003BF54C30
MTKSASQRDTSDLAAFGYRQRLDRTLGSFSSFAAGFSYLSILTGLPQLFYLGYGAGGPSFFWSWPIVFVGQFLVALCFAELSAYYPLAGGVYQWSRQIGPTWVGWMAGWVYLGCAVITLASVALALQATLPQISPVFQVIGRHDHPEDAARNAVLLGCVLLVFSMLVNAIGVRLLSKINNIGVIAELTGTVLLISLLFFGSRRGASVVLDRLGHGEGLSFGYLGPFLAAALVPSFVMYGFDSAGSLAEEISDPRRRAPRAILRALGAVGLAGALLIIGALKSVKDLNDPALGRISGGFPMIVRDVLGEKVGMVFLIDIALAIVVCTLTVHAGAVRLIFAMARDNSLPFSERLARIPKSSQTPLLPVVLLGLGAMLLLLVNVDFPQIIEVMASVAIVWANLAYLLVTAPLLVRRLRGRPVGGGLHPQGFFSLGRWGLLVNFLAVVWGVLIITNVAWPRPEVYGTAWYRLFGAPLATLILLLVGATYYGLIQRHKAGVLESHRAGLATPHLH